MQDVHHETTTTANNNNNEVSIPVTVGTVTIKESAVVPSCVVITPVNKNKKTGKRTNTVVTGVDVNNVDVVAASASTTKPKATKKPRVEKLPIEDIIGDYDDDLHVIGLSSGTQGRACCCHSICGEYLQVGDLVRLVFTINRKCEAALKVVKIESDGLPNCTLGFIPRIQSKISNDSHSDIHEDMIGRFCIVKEIYSQSSEKGKKEQSLRNRGMASLVYVESIPMSKLPYSRRYLNNIPHDE